jgi:hypothetical protein
MRKGGKGGARTNETGLAFEFKTSLSLVLAAAGYEVEDGVILHKGIEVGELAAKSKINKVLKKHNAIVEPPRVGKLEPDEAIYVKSTDTLFIVEKKFQSVEGSTDEKIQTAVYKAHYYNMLLEGTGIKLKFMYLLNDWFKKEKYNLVIEWLLENGVAVYFEEIPLTEFELART